MSLTVLAGLFLLMVSVYEAIWGASWAGPLVYLAPGVLFCLAALALLALSFISFEYRLVEDDFFLRARLLKQPFRARVIRLRREHCRLYAPYRPWQWLWVKKDRYYLPQLRGNRLCLLEYQGRRGRSYLLFRPNPALLQLLENHLSAGNEQWEEPEEVIQDQVEE